MIINMALRPVFLPIPTAPYVNVINVEFEWFAGFAISQKQKSIQSLHASAVKEHVCKKPLEASSKSEDIFGAKLSAFNILISVGDKETTLENVFQASKVFEDGGPYRDLLDVSPKDAKRDPRLKESGMMICFQGREEWPLEPKTMYYDWLFLNAINRSFEKYHQITEYDAFTDIEFNPNKSFSCQARSCALLVGLYNAGILKDALSSSDSFKKIMSPLNNSNQATLI